MMIDRMEKIAALMKREITVILQNEINDPRVEGVTVNRIEVSRDLRLAKIFCMIDGDEKRKQLALKGLHRAASFMRAELAARMAMKFTPKLSFREDLIELKGRSINSILDKIQKERNEQEESEELFGE